MQEIKRRYINSKFVLPILTLKPLSHLPNAWLKSPLYSYEPFRSPPQSYMRSWVVSFCTLPTLFVFTLCIYCESWSWIEIIVSIRGNTLAKQTNMSRLWLFSPHFARMWHKKSPISEKTTNGTYPHHWHYFLE